MKIRTLLIAGSSTLLAFTLGMAMLIVSATRRANAVAAEGALAGRLIQDFYLENSLAQEYAAHHDARPKEQWYVVQDRLAALLSQPTAPSRRDRIVALRSGTNELKTVFDSLVRLEESPSPDPALVTQTVGDLLVKSGTVVRVAEGLGAAAEKDRSLVRSRADRATLALLAVLAALMVSILLFLYVKIVGSISRLLKGAEIIGAGDLAYRIPGEGDSEIGRLSRGMNGMAAKLQGLYDTLERRVEDRTRELSDLTRRTETLLESIGDGVVAIDKNWKIIVWNAAAAHITGWTKKEALGASFRDIVKFVRERDRTENVLFISEAMLSNQARMMENHTVLIRKDGTEVPVGDSAAPFTGPDGKVAGAIVVFRDASAERDAHLVRSSFAYASHQLRTPVTRALWAIEELLGAKKQADVRENARVALTSLLSVRKLVTALADVSEIDQGIVVPKRECTSAAEVVDAAIGNVSEKAKNGGVRVVCGEIVRDEVCSTDKKLLVRALTEMLDNAIEYGQGSDVSVLVFLHDKQLVFSVADGGIGIAPEQQNLVFTKFFRGQNVPESSVGAGLGLYLCREYVRLLGGKAWFRVGEGKGTTFFISVPATFGDS